MVCEIQDLKIRQLPGTERTAHVNLLTETKFTNLPSTTFHGILDSLGS